MFKECLSLQSLDLHGNPVDLSELREMEGYKAYEERRQRKYNRQIGMQTMAQSFDEGADAAQHRKW